MNPSPRDRWLLELLGEELDGGVDAPPPHIVEDEELIARWSAARLAPHERDRLQTHLAACARCRRELGELLDAGIVVPPSIVHSTPHRWPSRSWPFAAIGLVAAVAAMLFIAIMVGQRDNPRDEVARARHAAEAGQLGDAVDRLERVLARDPDHAEARDLLQRFGLEYARSQLQAGRFDAVREVADRLAPHEAAPGRWLNLRLRAEDGRTTELALADAGTLLDYGYETDGRVRRKGLIELPPEFWKRLQEWQNAVAAHADEVVLHLNLGQQYLAARESEKALTEFDAVIGLDPFAAFGHAGRGLALFQREQFETARKSFERAVELEPESPAHRVNLAACLERQGLPADAKPHWRQARERTSDARLRELIDWHLTRPAADD